MNAKAEAVLSLLIDQFQKRNGRKPEKVVVAPLACLALAIKGSLAPVWNGIPVECRDIREEEASRDTALVRSLAVFVLPEGRNAALVGCGLKT